ncbi:MAG: phosphoribosylanthranilate isomerase [Rhodomicrobium sp.]|nr:phosphoribosylanthranilate isomerase [Rhodomicrobium sp.]
MAVEVKICGIKTPEALEAAIAAGASHFGMVFFPRSPRHVTLDEARRLADKARGRILSVALTVEAADEDILAILKAANPDLLQLHGRETPERTAQTRALAGRPVIKAVSIDKDGDAERASIYRDAADHILFDAKPPRNAANALPGGNGLAFDWRLLAPVKGKMPFILSGGLTPDNVAEAIARTGAAMVDVSSGVETAPGEKDAALIRRFVEAARAPALEEIANG